jgi:hypothetical protein
MTNSVVYEGIDWNHDAVHSLIKALSTSIVTFSFFLMIKVASKYKFWANGLQKKIDNAMKLQNKL